MNPYRAYRDQVVPAWTRIDMLLAAVDGVIESLTRASSALQQKDDPAALAALARGQVLVLGLASGINLDFEDASSINLLRLYEFVTHSIASKDPVKLEASLGVMRTLREGFVAIREEAVGLERSGAVPPAGAQVMVEATV